MTQQVEKKRGAGSNKSRRKQRVYQLHCRDMILAEMCNDPSTGIWVHRDKSIATHSNILNGYSGAAKKPLPGHVKKRKGKG